MLASATFVEPPKANPPPSRRRRSCGTAEGNTARAAAAAAPPKENPAPAPALRERGEREEEYLHLEMGTYCRGDLAAGGEFSRDDRYLNFGDTLVICS